MMREMKRFTVSFMKDTLSKLEDVVSDTPSSCSDGRYVDMMR